MYIEIIIYQFSYHDLFIIYFYNDQIVPINVFDKCK